MKYPLAAFILFGVVIIMIVLIFTNYNSTPQKKLNKVVANNIIDECYDNSMDSWFLEFNKSQIEGATMEEADNKASTKALLYYEDCTSGI